jgi:hypothetical protein
MEGKKKKKGILVISYFCLPEEAVSPNGSLK